MKEITFASKGFFDEIASRPQRHVHLIVIATKPDIIKQVPLYRELKKRGHIAVLGHTGQHYSENLSGGMLKEFGVEPDFNLNAAGHHYEVVAQIIQRLGWVMAELKQRGKIVIPYVHGDTTTAMAASNAGYCNGFASVHVEAGIRTLTPDYEKAKKQKILHGGQVDAEAWYRFLQDRNHWKRGSLEPYPEQFNTRASEAATGIHLAPVELDREFLLAEGFPEDRIEVVGNSVVDATAEAVANAKSSTIFDRYPQLADGDFVRFCIHRRENCGSDRRFKAIWDALVSFVKEGRTVLLISMFQTESAFKRLGLVDEVHELAKKYPTFIYSPVWPQYTDVIAVMQRAALCATDSGSMQEEMNALDVPCATLRFGSDRSESIISGGNTIVPPTDGPTVRALLLHAWDNKAMRDAPRIYGHNVSGPSIDFVESILAREEIFRDEEARLGL